MSKTDLDRCKKKQKRSGFARIVILVCLPLLILYFFLPMSAPLQTKLEALEVWTIFGIWMLVYFLPDLKLLAKRITKFRIGGVGVELEELQNKTIKNTRNEYFVYGTMFAQNNRWTEAADIFRTLRDSEDPMTKIAGLVESAALIVMAIDKDAEEFLSNFGTPASQDRTRYLLIKAREFCDWALWIAGTMDEVKKQLPTVHYKRAIVNSRLWKKCNCDKAKESALEDLREAIERDSDMLLQVTFDQVLSDLSNGEDFKSKGAQEEEFDPSAHEREFIRNFLRIGVDQ